MCVMNYLYTMSHIRQKKQEHVRCKNKVFLVTNKYNIYLWRTKQSIVKLI
jgi:hypothetical protein